MIDEKGMNNNGFFRRKLHQKPEGLSKSFHGRVRGCDERDGFTGDYLRKLLEEGGKDRDELLKLPFPAVHGALVGVGCAVLSGESLFYFPSSVLLTGEHTFLEASKGLAAGTATVALHHMPYFLSETDTATFPVAVDAKSTLAVGTCMGEGEIFRFFCYNDHVFLCGSPGSILSWRRGRPGDFPFSVICVYTHYPGRTFM
jgi:hypothetical protein